jgi:hypothetical protein
MLAAIDFDYQAAFNGAKINEIRTNRKLTPELNVAKPPASKMTPEKFLRHGLLAA